VAIAVAGWLITAPGCQDDIRRGRDELQAGRWDAAAAIFAGYTESADPTRAEAVLVGLMRARLGQHRLDAVKALVDRYAARFPEGARRDEVARVRAAAGL